ncbi:MAG: hypothetical protein ICV60_23755 [Pyrinomonadaceae bacterium]|nr:hypothetical protein [Pyrinomonadaceae bacterium]
MSHNASAMNPQQTVRYWFTKVRYGDFEGDLILLPRKIYYFGQKVKLSKPMDEGAMFGSAAGVMGVPGVVTSGLSNGAELNENVRLFERPKMNIGELWKTKTTAAELEEALDKFVSEAKNYRTVYSEDLPPPRCYSSDAITNLTLSFPCKLAFDTEYDKHLFRVGFFSRGRLRKALAECGFTS